MNITDIQCPIVKILTDHDMRAVSREADRLCLDGWARVGDQTKFNHQWNQVLVKQSDDPVRPAQKKGDKALKKIMEG